MQYMILIYTEAEVADPAPMEDWWKLDAEMRESGQYVAGDALHPVSTAKTVRIRDGETMVTDGPFAETKELLGGYYLVDVDSEAEALEWAAKIPSTPYGSTEVRRVFDFEAEGTMPGAP